MRHAIATVSLSGTLEEKLAAAAAARFDAVEIFEADLLYFSGTPREVRAIAADLGLLIALFQPFRDFEGVPDDEFRRNLERAERKFDVMHELGAPLMLVCSNVGQHTLDDSARAAAQLNALGERAAKRGLRVGYEALAWGRRVRTFGQAWQLVEQAAHPHLGLILDSFHTLALNDDPAPIAALPGSRIFFVQLADAPRLAMDPLSWSRHFRCFPGQGDLDLAGFLEPVLRAGYSGPLSLEIFNDDFRAAPPRQTASDGRRGLQFLEEQVARRVATGTPPARRFELFAPPPPPVFDGVAFIEFAVDRNAERALAGWLDRLGFRRAGRHRTKDVTLFRQGGINLVLNAEPDSFAHSYFLVHGPAVCAIGLRCSDELQALSRAEAFGCTRFEGRVGPNERTIPAVRALDGSLVYFVAGADDPLDTDFVIEPAGDEAGAGLTRVDHIAEALPAGQFDGWLLFYRAVLGHEPEPLVELADPYGLVRSRAVASRNRALRFPRNISDRSNTATARSVSTFAGAGVHHIAFASTDVFATASRWRDAGVPVLRIPDNYYDDLAARLDLAPDLLAKLREHAVLYDRGPTGAYLQCYTEAFEERFFIEAVQRLDGYDAYGAANAPVRMAAQAHRRAALHPVGEIL
jgi:4-hydroxyphenylpyruvate dioxygenase